MSDPIDLFGDFMRKNDFNLNDIEHEPTDAQLRALMDSVALEANRRSEQAKKVLMERLRDEIIQANA